MSTVRLCGFCKIFETGSGRVFVLADVCVAHLLVQRYKVNKNRPLNYEIQRPIEGMNLKTPYGTFSKL